MDIIIAVALLLVGTVIGFFAARFWYTKGQSQTSVKQAENDLKSLLSQQAEHHLFQNRQLIETVEKQCRSMKEQLDNYESLLTPDETQTKPAVTFYGEHASTYLRNTLQQDAKLHQASSTDTQPRDFAVAGSGLFAGQSEESTEKSAENAKGTNP